MDIAKTHKQLINGETSSEKLTISLLDKIKKENDRLGAFITICENEAIASAKKADERIKSGKDVTPLTGIPIAIKDILATKGIRTTCGSKLLENYIPPYSATAVEKLGSAGAVILGKLNMDEFAMGSSNEHSAFFPARNPYDTSRTPGGSSGGSAVAVAGKLAFATLGTDTGGSIRQPASMCGIVGIKPTYGRVSRYGQVAFASSLDQIGPMTNNCYDAGLVLNAICGRDEKDSTSLTLPAQDLTKGIGDGIKGLKIGIPKEYFIKGIETDVETSVQKGIESLKKAGAEIVAISLPHTEYALACYYIIAPAEASANLARFDGIRYGLRLGEKDGLRALYEQTRSRGFGEEVKLRIMVGTYVLSSGYYDAYYKKAQRVRTLITKDFEEAFKKVDIIVTPTSPTTAFKLGEKLDDPVQMYLSDIFTIPVNIAGLPALSVPCGLDSKGLPIGLQMIGRHLDEATILRAGYTFENLM